ncbi:MAG: GAF domain-containing protein [Bacteroidota bacterium]
MKYDPIDLLVTTVQELSLAKDLQTLMYIVRKAARKCTGADGVTFVLNEKEYCYYADEDAIAPLWKGQRFPIHACISGWVMVNRMPAIIKDIYQDSRIPHDSYKGTFVKSLAMVPIRTLEPLGALGAYWASPYIPDEQELRMLQAIADVTAVAFTNVQRGI